ncbi:alpha and gamma adaptin binding protein p34-domain-containing protein [Sordaria brevicollis]|uniref:Alpha and gamma adaptin binding protein p34-domain-containing protein n=1 Tax=Sordaria brevicollis TaxID=83679 RepID=A0AAE0PN28_SORBR|nr:alpha and gamma adaptin binding protein p34-domain-containing protein [Sordaria brevicollis]
MAPSKPEEITNPRRILAVALTDSSDHLGAVIRDLTGTSPTPQQQQPPPSSQDDDDVPSSPSDQQTPELPPSLAGTTHPLPLSTPYYTASIPIWLDLISSPAEWSASFLSEEAKEVLGVLGGVVCVFEIPSPSQAQSSAQQKERTKSLVQSVGKVVREGLGGWEWEGVGLAVGVTSLTKDGEMGVEVEGDMEDEINEWDDLCGEWGLEFVHHRISPDSKGKDKKKEEEKRNEYGEKMGIARVLEALQSNDWSGGDGASPAEGGPLDDSDEEEEEEYIDPNDWDTEDEFDLGFGYTRLQKAEMRKAFWKGAETSDKSTVEELKEFRDVMQTIDGSRGNTWDAGMKSHAREGFWKQFEDEVLEKVKNAPEEKGKGKKTAAGTGKVKAGPSAEAGSGSGADKAKKQARVEDDEEEEIGEDDVEKIAKMMMKLQAVRDMSGSMPEEQRRKLAMKAVEEVMREL